MTAYIKSKKFKKKNHNKGLAVLNTLVCFFVVCLIIFCLVQANNLVSHSFEIREQKKQIAALETENRDLEDQIAQWRSPSNLENLIQELEMVEVGEVIYLKSEKAVAVRD